MSNRWDCDPSYREHVQAVCDRLQPAIQAEINRSAKSPELDVATIVHGGLFASLAVVSLFLQRSGGSHERLIAECNQLTLRWMDDVNKLVKGVLAETN